ncbi:histidine kinase [Mesorhizobium denitrificans]|uniref:histidine kinase n=2 Tax=Phyllobacteriaceae TaxID=69277 RepID=A0A371XK89_9HYPH|nr:histidine kinase [Mesorhizobium denitrificans]
MVGWTSALFAIGLAALFVIVGATAWLMNQTAEYADAAVSARETRVAIVDLRSLVQDAESGQRGYLLTSKKSYLVPFETARNEIPKRLEILRNHASSNAVAAALIDDLSSTIDAKLAELSQTVNLVNDNKHVEALAIVDSDVGKKLMDDASAQFDIMIAAADKRFAQSIAEQRSSFNALQFVSLIGALIIVSVVAGAIWIFARYTRELNAAQVEIEELNEGLEERIKERTVELGRANEEIQRFAYIVTHDLRAPLVNIMGFTSELEASIAPIQTLVKDAQARGLENEEARISASEDLPEAISFIRSSTKKMDGLINAILKLSREGRRELVPEPITLRPLIEQCLDSVQHQINASGGEAVLDVRASQIVSDRLSLEQVLGNLIDNAVKYAQPDRPLRINIRTKPVPGHRIAIEIEDNGRGIADHDSERVFDLFRRSGTQNVAGEGIGLAYVRSAIRNLGGEITLASRLGEGTTFTITLPEILRTAARTQQ